jgi:GTP:adenosylcobinamide-phosphate guanylyltransferase
MRWGGRSRDQAGTAALELVALLPVLVLVADLALQGGAAVWAVSAADNAARSAARAQSLGQDFRAVCETALPAGVSLVDCHPEGNRVVVTLRIAKVSPLPVMTVTRSAEMPTSPGIGTEDLS